MGIFLSLSYLILRVSEEICGAAVGLCSELPEPMNAPLSAKTGVVTIKLTTKDNVVLEDIFFPFNSLMQLVLHNW